MIAEENQEQTNTQPQKRFSRAQAFFYAHQKRCLAAFLALDIAIIAFFMSYFWVGSYGTYILSYIKVQSGNHGNDTSVEQQQTGLPTNGIVFGSGVTSDGKPYPGLQARLDSAAKAVKDGVVSKLLLTGDNRFAWYDEPTAMKNYLVEKKGIDASILVLDQAGRSTYESCERAAKIYSIRGAILFSAESHLPRAIFSCRAFGIESYGIASGYEANNATRRELLARPKAVFNQYIIGEKTVLGPKIKF